MQSVIRRGCLALAAVALLLSYGATAEAQDLALGKPVIDESGDWGHQFGAGNQYFGQDVTDGVNFESNQNEKGPGMSSYWLGREGTLGEYVTVDLQAPVLIGEIDLRNTSNAFFHDRSTKNFHIDASNAVDASNHLISPTTILSGMLAPDDNLFPLDKVAQQFPVNTGGLSYRYIRFTADTSNLTNNNVGLNEIEVFAIPEPAGLALLASGLGLLGGIGAYHRWRRRREREG
jgi:hypothetical protein